MTKKVKRTSIQNHVICLKSLGMYHMLFNGWEVCNGKDCPRSLECGQRWRLRVELKTKSTVSSSTGRRRVNNVFLFS